MTPALAFYGLEVKFATRRGTVHAVNGIDLELGIGETVGLIGESGCGKSTLGRAVMGIAPVADGRLLFDGTPVKWPSRKRAREERAQVQMVFQDSGGALNPRHTVGYSIGQPLALMGWHAASIKARVDELISQVGLPADAADRYPSQFSGGQRQRIGIARALALQPRVIVCDEPVSALDVSVRAQIINLLADLQRDTGVTFLFISHDLAVVEHVADRIVVMYLGSVVETGTREEFWRRPLHPYTHGLMAAIPIVDPVAAKTRQREMLQGELASPLKLPSGCPFHPRCPRAVDRCRVEPPKLRRLPSGSQVACHVVGTSAEQPAS
jgi:peptide/nickel transport system ATP-binding protein